ncbi:DNA-directed RNA polymerase II subunit RPB1-like 3, partial [Homarus americanus]
RLRDKAAGKYFTIKSLMTLLAAPPSAPTSETLPSLVYKRESERVRVCIHSLPSLLVTPPTMVIRRILMAVCLVSVVVARPDRPAPAGYGYPVPDHPLAYTPPPPEYRTPEPSYRAPEPTYEAPAPSYRAPEPSYEAPAPSYKAPEPTYSAPATSYKAPEPTYSAPATSYKAPEPTYSAPATSYKALDQHTRSCYILQGPEPTYSTPSLHPTRP